MNTALVSNLWRKTKTHTLSIPCRSVKKQRSFVTREFWVAHLSPPPPPESLVFTCLLYRLAGLAGRPRSLCARVWLVPGEAIGEIKDFILAPRVIIYSKSQAWSLENECFAAMEIIKMLCDVVLFILTIFKTMPFGLQSCGKDFVDCVFLLQTDFSNIAPVGVPSKPYTREGNFNQYRNTENFQQARFSSIM